MILLRQPSEVLIFSPPQEADTFLPCNGTNGRTNYLMGYTTPPDASTGQSTIAFWPKMFYFHHICTSAASTVFNIPLSPNMVNGRSAIHQDFNFDYQGAKTVPQDCQHFRVHCYT